MKCTVTDAQWTDYLDQTLPVAERRTIEAHFHACPACREQLEIYRQIEQRLRIECGLIRESIDVSQRVWRVSQVLALLCGSTTATRIIQAAESHTRPSEQKWVAFLQRLASLTSEICGSHAGDLIRAVGQS